MIMLPAGSDVEPDRPHQLQGVALLHYAFTQRVVEAHRPVHELILDYMQGPALDVALQLFVKGPSDTKERLVRAATIPPPPKRD